MEKGTSLSVLLSATILFLLIPCAAGAASIQETVYFAEPEIGVAGDFSTVSIKGCPEVGLPGEPLLPAYGVSILLPQGEQVVRVVLEGHGEVGYALDLPLECAQEQHPLSLEGPFQRTLPDDEIYRSEDAFPAERALHVSTETFRGYNIAFLRVYPAVYVGSDNSLRYTPSITVTVETRPSAQAMERSLRTLRRGNEKDVAALERIVDNAEDARSYVARYMPEPLASLVNAEDSYPYVIITNSTLQASFEDIRALKDAQGYKAKIVLVSDITSNYAGDDTQMKIRNFIIDAYQNWETEFVLLAGDDEIIPHRGLYADAGGTVDADIAADLYYMALDGNWNTDGDARWGEPDEADLVPEVSCGRAAVSDVTEAGNFIAKIVKYQVAPVTGQVENALMAGELLWDDPTWGGDYKEEIRLGSSAHGYTTAGFPGNFTVTTLYDKDLNPVQWTKDDIIPYLNGGMHIVNHLGHCNTTYGLRMVNSDVETGFSNDGVTNTYNIIYTQGCYAASFDNRTSGGSYTDDCIGEHFCFIENGAVAFVSNTRYGWGAHSSTRGASQYYDRQFFDAVFGEDITLIGLADVDSRVDNIPFIDATGPGRWVYYELVLLGDPAMDIWTGVPGTVTALYPETIYVGENEVAVKVTGSGPVEGARVSIFCDSTYSFGYTNAEGYAYVDPVALETGELCLTITAHNFYAYNDTVPVGEAADPLMILTDFPIDDDGSGSSSGNSNGSIDAGEVIESAITVENIGQSTATDVAAVLRSQDAYIGIVDSTTSFSSIPPDGQGTASTAFTFTADPNLPDGEVLDLEVCITYSDTAVTRHVSFTALAPILAVKGLSFDDSGYGNGDDCIEPGETVELSIVFRNDGTGDGEDVSVFISSSDSYVSITSDSSHASNVPSGGTAVLSPAYVIALTPDCPEFHQIEFDLDIQFASGRQSSAVAGVQAGGSLEDDMESGEGPWTHEVVNNGYVDEWHLETYRNHTGGGTYSWKSGGSGSSGYSDYSNGALMTPALCLGPNAVMTLWHYMDAEVYGGNPPYTWDGGIVEISTDFGEMWTQVVPNGGYPHLIYPNAASPFPGDTPCYGSTSGWQQAQFDLSGYSGQAIIRFQFGSDGYVTEEGWYIDDINVTDDYASVDIDAGDMENVPVSFALRIAGGNPVVSSARVSFDVPRRASVAIDVFDVRGRVVSNLADSVFEPGTYIREWDSSRFSPGVYFVRMRSLDFEKTHKIISIR